MRKSWERITEGLSKDYEIIEEGLTGWGRIEGVEEGLINHSLVFLFVTLFLLQIHRRCLNFIEKLIANPFLKLWIGMFQGKTMIWYLDLYTRYFFLLSFSSLKRIVEYSNLYHTHIWTRYICCVYMLLYVLSSNLYHRIFESLWFLLPICAFTLFVYVITMIVVLVLLF